ncbi:MAG: hypothetical protein E6G94_16445 [Alphaproteobacteria bacterium]|nr:MAG: hypothetical protein E6G94_16445 [Alphaproteobacteria bacterium]
MALEHDGGAGKTGFFSRSRSHLNQVGLDYFGHARFAFSVGGTLVSAGAACLLHGLLPGVFQDTASKTILKLHDKITKRGIAHGTEDGSYLGLEFEI